jgi:hypothetical protein
MANFGLWLALAILLLSVVMAHRIARRKRRNAVFWGSMAALFGPLALPLLLVLKSLPPSDRDTRD